ncbi:MAG: hypothetical protein JW909_12450 [Planctomycetes bacterium]|nr:hypothetical protein [Planctomycetota bacterium]
MKAWKCLAIVLVGLVMPVLSRPILCQEPAPGGTPEAVPAPAGGEAPAAEDGAASPEAVPEERPIVLDRKVRVESAGMEFRVDSGWSFTESAQSTTKLDGRGPSVFGLRTAMSIWQVQSRLGIVDIYESLKAYLKAKNKGFTVKSETLSMNVQGLDARRIDLVGDVQAEDGSISIRTIYTYVIINRVAVNMLNGTSLSVGDTVFNLVYPEEQSEQYEKYLNKLLTTFQFYGPGYTVGKNNTVTYNWYTFQLPADWNLDILYDPADDIQDRKEVKEVYKLILSRPTLDTDVQIRTILSTKLSSPKDYADELRSSFLDNTRITNLNLSEVEKSARYRLTFDYRSGGTAAEEYVVDAFVTGEPVNVLQVNSTLLKGVYPSLKRDFETVGISIVPPKPVAVVERSPR